MTLDAKKTVVLQSDSRVQIEVLIMKKVID